MFDANDPLLPAAKPPRGHFFKIVVGGVVGAFATMALFFLTARLAQPLEPYFSDGQAGFGLAIGAMLGWLVGATATAIAVLSLSVNPVGVGRVLGVVAVILVGAVWMLPFSMLLQLPLMVADAVLNELIGWTGSSSP